MTLKRGGMAFFLLIVLSAYAAFGCGKDAEGESVPAPVVVSLVPDYLQPGGTLMVYGKNFGSDAGAIRVLFDGREYPAKSLSGNRVGVTVPDGGQDGRPVSVRLSRDGNVSEAVSSVWRTDVPEITGIDGGRGVYGELVTVAGKRFGTAGESAVYFDETEAEITEESETALTVKVPRIYKEDVSVTVVRGGVRSNAVSFSYDLDRCDSLLIVTAGWKTEQLREGVVWKSAFLKAFDAPQSMNVVYVTPSQQNRLRVGCSVSGVRRTSSQCGDAGALLGVNGGYFDEKKKPFVKIGGTVVQSGYDRVSSTFGNAAIVIRNNRVEIRKVAGCNAEARTLEGDDILVCGPFLLKDGVVEQLSTSTPHNTARHPRTAVGVTGDGDVIFLTVDGRFPGKAAGMTTPQLAKAMRALGADDAMNLDGGGSTTLWISGKGVVNYPCDNGAFDHEGERSVGSILYVR